MMGMAIAALMLFGYRQYVIKSPSTLICMIAVCAALLNQFAQGILPGNLGIGVSLFVSGIATVLVARKG